MAAQRCCPDAAPRPLQLVESYDTSIPTLIEALRRHGCCLAVAGTMEAAGRERGRCGRLGPERVFLKQQSPTQRKGGEASRSIEGAVAELFFRHE